MYNLKKFLTIFCMICMICMIYTFSILKVMACPAGDEFGRPYFEIFNHDYTFKTMFYLSNSHYYRRELCLLTDTHSIRESFSFPIVGRSVPELYGVWGTDEIFYPTLVDASGTHFRLYVGLENMFQEWKAFAENSPDAIDDMFFDILVERLHDDRENANFIEASRRLEESDFTQVLTHMLRIDHGIIFGDRVFNEIRDDIRINFDPVLSDPITINMCDCYFHFISDDIDPHNVVAINVENLPGHVEVHPVVYENNLFSFTIWESGTFVLVYNEAEAEEIIEYVPYETAEESDFTLAIIIGVLALATIIPAVIIIKSQAHRAKTPPRRGRGLYKR
ncbi:MAG: hypothetical protein FWF81_08205 [Defluviitaleaceae bacterium]|nr:hypothetical protein [Defluviitaleaceae bacterium]